MGRRGPRPTPTAKLRLVGSPVEKRRRNVPTPKAEAPSAPSWLSAEAKAEWKRIVPQLESVGVLATIDRAIVTIYCESWAEFVQMRTAVAESGRTFQTANGYQQQHPNVGMMNNARAAVLRFAQELGLSPSARTRVAGLPKRGADDPLGDFARKGKPDRAG